MALEAPARLLLLRRVLAQPAGPILSFRQPTAGQTAAARAAAAAAAAAAGGRAASLTTTTTTAGAAACTAAALRSTAPASRVIVGGSSSSSSSSKAAAAARHFSQLGGGGSGSLLLNGTGGTAARRAALLPLPARAALLVRPLRARGSGGGGGGASSWASSSGRRPFLTGAAGPSAAANPPCAATAAAITARALWQASRVARGALAAAAVAWLALAALSPGGAMMLLPHAHAYDARYYELRQREREEAAAHAKAAAAAAAAVASGENEDDDSSKRPAAAAAAATATTITLSAASAQRWWRERALPPLQRAWAAAADEARTLLRGAYLLALFTPAVLSAPALALLGGWWGGAEARARRRARWVELVRWTLEHAGPAFIKWGQWAATRPDLFPPDVCESLARLQSDAPAHAPEETVAAVERAFGRPLADLFDTFDPRPVASGSIAQVHKATLSARAAEACGVAPGTVVAVKVRHPRAPELMARDFELMRRAAALSAAVPGLRDLRLDESVRQFGTPLREQLDLSVEAASLARFAHNFRRWRRVRFPAPYYPLVSPEVLVESFEEGALMNGLVRASADTRAEVAAERLRRIERERRRRRLGPGPASAVMAAAAAASASDGEERACDDAAALLGWGGGGSRAVVAAAAADGGGGKQVAAPPPTVAAAAARAAAAAAALHRAEQASAAAAALKPPLRRRRAGGEAAGGGAGGGGGAAAGAGGVTGGVPGDAAATAAAAATQLSAAQAEAAAAHTAHAAATAAAAAAAGAEGGCAASPSSSSLPANKEEAAAAAAAAAAPLAAADADAPSSSSSPTSVLRAVAAAAAARVRESVAETGLRAYLQMLLADNFVHADMHPGNILVRELDNAYAWLLTAVPGADFLLGAFRSAWAALPASIRPPAWLEAATTPQLVLLDTGMTAELARGDQRAVVAFFRALSLQDGSGVAKAVLEMADRDARPCRDPAAFERDLRAMFDSMDAETLRVYSAQVFRDVVDTIRQHGVVLRSAVSAVVVTTLVLEGWSSQLHPDLRVLDAVRDLLASDWRERVGKAVDGVMMGSGGIAV